MRNYDAVIFDLDGTLLDTSEGIFRSVGYVIESCALPAISDEVLRTFIGPPIQRSFARVYGLSKDEADEKADIFRNRYKEDDLLLARPYDGMIGTIATLRKAGIKTAVATYKRHDYAKRLLEHFGFDEAVDAIFGSDMEGKLSKKDIIENAIRHLGITDYKRVVMVGDSDNDAIGAKEIGVPFIGVTYGFGFADAKAVSAFDNVGIANTPEEIAGIIL